MACLPKVLWLIGMYNIHLSCGRGITQHWIFYNKHNSNLQFTENQNTKQFVLTWLSLVCSVLLLKKKIKSIDVSKMWWKICWSFQEFKLFVLNIKKMYFCNFIYEQVKLIKWTESANCFCPLNYKTRAISGRTGNLVQFWMCHLFHSLTNWSNSANLSIILSTLLWRCSIKITEFIFQKNNHNIFNGGKSVKISFEKSIVHPNS